MLDSPRFKLLRLIELGSLFSRYSAALSNGTEVELCLIHSCASSSSNKRNEIPDFFQRLELVQLIGCPSCLPVLDFEESETHSFVAFPAGSKSLEELLIESVSVDADLERIAQACISALVDCRDAGLVIGGVTAKSVRKVGEAQWQVDVTGLSSASPALNGSLGVMSTDPSFESDVLSVATLMHHVLERSGLNRSTTGQSIRSLFSDCLFGEAMKLPTPRELLERLQKANPATIDSGDCPAEKSVAAISDATLEVDPEIELPVGFLAEGTQLGRYVIRERLGIGGMGAVYRAEDSVEKRSVAIKVLNKKVDQDSIFARRFAKEARLLAKANNPYVASLFEVASEGETPYMVVEFLDGGTLGSLLKSGRPLNEQFALSIIVDATRGLAIAHSRGVVHRDFKPDNVLLTSDAKNWIAENSHFASSAQASVETGKIYAKVSDFGLARTSQQTESMALTREGALLGTPLYMSPEQCQGKATDPRTDVYSVGVTLFQMLSGKTPFEADTQVALLNLHCNAAPPSLKKIRPELSDALVQVVEKCLTKNPDARYADAGDLAIDLENIMRGQPTSLGLHPPVLSLNDPEVMRFEHTWELQSSAHQLWPYIANTDRVNHAIGLPAVTYTVKQDPIRGAVRMAETRVAGLLIRWVEHPYEWIEGRRMSVFREFTHGPFRWFVNIVELQSTVGGGTRVTQRFLVSPRNWVGRQLAKVQLGKKSTISFGRIYEQIDSFLVRSEINKADRDPFIGRTELRSAQRRRLQSRLGQLKLKPWDPRVVDALGQFLENASDLEVARIRPIAFAERFQLDSNQVINAFLEGSRLGIFSLLWDIMCPSCRIPSNVQETLAAIKDHGYCEACNLDFGVDLAESVELIFRVHPEIRDVTTAVYCIGGPAWSRHVVAQVRLAAGERFACELGLSEGAYVLRGLQLPFTIDLRVSHGSVVKRVELSLARPPASPRIDLAIGSQVIHLCNDSAVDQQVRIERTAGRHDALSAARASTMALFRELFPGETLAADQIVSVAHITVMRIQIHGAQRLYASLGDSAAFVQVRTVLQQTLALVKEQSGAVVKTIGEGVLASFPDATSAVTTAIELLRRDNSSSLKISVAIHSGAAMVATIEDRLDYFGKTLQTLELLLSNADVQTLRVTSAVAETIEVQSLLQQKQLRLALIPPDASVPEDLIALQVFVDGSPIHLKTSQSI